MRIVLTGPESAGKSELTKKLSVHYQGCYVDEFAREYIEELGKQYEYEDVVRITKHQLEEYDNLQKHNGFCFFDTYLIITKIWFLHAYNKLPEWFEDEFKQRPMDLYLLCKPDLKWKPDGVRENENIRDLLFNKYKEELENYGFNYIIISGVGEKRLKNAISAIDKFLNKISI